MAVKDRVVCSDLSKEPSQTDITKLLLQTFLPSVGDCQALHTEIVLSLVCQSHKRGRFCEGSGAARLPSHHVIVVSPLVSLMIYQVQNLSLEF